MRTAVACLLLAVLAVVAVAADGVEIASGTYDLKELTSLVAQTTGRTILYGPDFSGSVRLEIAKPELKPDELWELYLSALAQAGWGVVVHDRVVRIVPQKDLAGESGPVIMAGEEKRDDDGMVTALFELNNANPAEIAMKLAPLVGKDGRVIPLPAQGRLVVVASAANVEKVREVLGKLDVPDKRDNIQIVRVKHADLNDTADVVGVLFGRYKVEDGKIRSRQAAGGVIVAVEPRSASLVLRGEKDEVELAARLIHEIDAAGDPIIMIRTLRHASPGEATAVLEKLLAE
ncbi:MAG: secretin N-terminal domain-containing protein [Candidatus Lernaella stagnicola]|nr:secretin N-terminal domain-containing protein [Candidatus Lernaella stagnicola]